MEYPRVSDEDRGKLVVRLRDSAHFILTAADEEGWSATDLTRGISHLALQAATEIEDARALLLDAAEALREALPYVGEFEGPMYGPFPGGDPREFTPDREDNTPEEVAAWEAACAEWDTGNGVDRGPGCDYMGDGSARTGTGFGMGSWTVKAPEAERIRELLARIEGGASS